MGVRSTYTISRKLAIKILEHNLDRLSDNDIAAALCELPESEFRNYQIVDEVGEVEEGDKAITNERDFYE